MCNAHLCKCFYVVKHEKSFLSLWNVLYICKMKIKYIPAIILSVIAGVIFLVYWLLGACFLIFTEILEYGIKLYYKVKRPRLRGHK
jgi:hypothetical protein